MTKKKTDSYAWINTPPSQDHIETINGAEFIPIGIVETLLYKLDSHWGTENFKFQVIELMGVPLVSGSLELVVTYGGRTRRLVGAATLPVDPTLNMLDPYVNANFSAVLKSECTKNAVKPIGLSMGQGLNDRTVITTPQKETPNLGKAKRPALFPQPDEAMQGSYNRAVESVNQPLMKSIKNTYPDIQYTGYKIITDAQNGMDQ